MGLVFERLTGEDDRAFIPFSQGAIDQLEGITAADKAQAVPYVRIWQVDASTGEPINANPDFPSDPIAPLNLQLAAPPRFGASQDERFRERPPVSLERISIKTNAPRGVITYQQIEMAFVVHRPDVIFDNPQPGVDNWSSMITPGMVHCMEYGWSASSGVRNGILNGEGYSDLESKPPCIVAGRKRLRFVVTNYSFKILPDSQISINVTAFEEGDFNLRQAILGAKEVRELSRETKQIPGPFGGAANVPKYDPQELYTEVGRKVVKALQDKVMSLKGSKTKGNDELIKFSTFADVVLAPTIELALNDIGFTKVKLVMGDFNKRAGKPGPKYRLNYSGDSAYIGDFEIPMKEIEKIFNDSLKSGSQITLYNFINQFLIMFRNPQTWDRKNAKTDEGGMHMSKIPHVMVRTQMNPTTKAAIFFIVDIEREFTKFTDSERKPEVAKSRSEVRDILRAKGVPVVSMMKGNSYIQDASFDVVTDDKIKGILMRRYLRPARTGVVDANIKQKSKTAVDPREVMYSSAIQGDLTILGNFVFDLFGLVWLDFGVSKWDGPFSVREREEIIDRTGFNVRLSLIAEGSDPLGTQGRLSDAKIKQVNDEDRKAQQGKKPKKR